MALGDIKPTIVSNVTQALRSQDDEPPTDKRRNKLLTSIAMSMKKSAKEQKKSFNRTKERTDLKVKKTTLDVLKDIKKNTKDKDKGGPLKVLLVFLGSVIVAAFKRFKNLVMLFGKGIKKFGLLTKKIITGIGKGISGVFFAITKSFKGGFFKNLGAGFSNLFNKIFKSFKGTRLANIFKSLGAGSGKAFGAVKKLGSIFGKIGGLFGVVGKLGRALRPVLGVLGKLFLPLTILISVFDGIKGLLSAGDFFDKKKGEVVTLGEKVSAVLGSILSGLTFGLLGSGKEMAKGLHKVFTKPEEFFKEDFPRIVTNFGNKLLKGLTKVGEFVIVAVKGLFNFINKVDWVGILKSIGTFISSAFSAGIIAFKKGFSIVLTKITDVFKSIDWPALGKRIIGVLFTGVKLIVKVLWTVFKEIPGLLFTIITNVGPLIFSAIKGAIGLVWGLLQGLGSVISEILSGLPTIIWNGIKGVFTFVWEMLQGTDEFLGELFSGLGNMILTGFKDVFNSVWGRLQNIGGFVNETLGGFPSLVWDGITGIFLNVWDRIKGIGGWIKDTFSSLPGLIWDSFTSAFGFGDDDIPQTISKPVKDVQEAVFQQKKIKEKELKAKEVEQKQVKIKQEDKQQIFEGVSIAKEASEAERMLELFNFLKGEFSDVMAKKIAAANKGKSLDAITEPRTRIL